MDMLTKVFLYIALIIGILTIAVVVINIVTAVVVLVKEILGIENFSIGGNSG